MRKGKYNLYNSQSIHKVYRVCTNYMYIVWSKLLDDDYKGISISLRALITHLGDKVSHHLCLRNTSLNVKWLLFYRSSQNLQCVNELWVSTVLFLNLTNRGGIHPDTSSICRADFGKLCAYSAIIFLSDRALSINIPQEMMDAYFSSE